jgi:UDP-N-acetylmuramate-alanine ligase
MNQETVYIPDLAFIWESLSRQSNVDAIFFLGAGNIAQIIPELEQR